MPATVAGDGTGQSQEMPGEMGLHSGNAAGAAAAHGAAASQLLPLMHRKAAVGAPGAKTDSLDRVCGSLRKWAAW